MPNQKSLLQTAEVRVANRLRQLRIDKGLTLSELATSAGLSQAFLSRIENHKLSIPISGLEKLAQVLNVPIRTFFEEAQEIAPIVLCRKGKGVRKHFREPQSLIFELLAVSKPGKLMEPMLLDIPHATEPLKLISHPGDEFNYVVEGELYFLYGKQKILLKKGDSVYYDATIPHAMRSIPHRRGVILSVIASKDYLFHGDLTNFLKGTSR